MIDRRAFLKLGSAAAAAGTAFYVERKMAFLQASPGITQPLQFYPNRGWEKVYRDQYAYDDSFTFVCAPNCTHNCRLRAFVRNGVVIRTEQNYDGQAVGDLNGKFSTNAWNPRGCNKGATLTRRIYGPYRLKGPMIRAGWKKWADAGFPRLTPELRTQYKFDNRGTDTFVKVNWDDTFKYAAKGLEAVAKTYSGEEGKKILLSEGYQPEMVDAVEGAGTRTIKIRGGMGLLGVMGKYGMYRSSNMLALLDMKVRNLQDHNEAKGGRNWSNYTWHGDQAPGVPFVTGLQNPDCDFNDMRNAKLHIGVGKNLVENKMADAHFFIEMMERGGKIVTITPEYSPPATKADYWIPTRPGLGDLAIFLAVTKLLMDRNLYDAPFVKQFTDFPLLLRKDTLKRLDPKDVIAGYTPALDPNGPSYKVQGITKEQYAKLQDYVIYDATSKSLKAITRDDVGEKMAAKNINPDLEYAATITLLDGKAVEVTTLWQAYKAHLADYDVATASEISGAPANLIEQLATDLATIKPAAIHVGEGINHWFHATMHNRAVHLPLMLTGNIGKPGAGVYSWAGNYKAALFQGTPETGPGFKGWIAEDPFEMNLDPTAKGKDIHAHAYTKDEEPAYWDHGDQALVVDTPEGHKVFTGKSHMPTPTKVMWTTNVNIINNAKWAYGVLFNTLPRIDMIMTQDIEMTLTCEYSDFILPANSWLEIEQPEVTASCQNPFLQIWKGGVKSMFDTKDDISIMAGVAKALTDLTGDQRFADYWKFTLEGRTDIYMQRLLDASGTTNGYTVKDVMAGKYGEPGSALMMFRTYPRIPYWEQIHDNMPFHTDTGRMNSYCDIPEAIDYGENFIVHREGPEATPYLPNVIVSSNPLIRPKSYGIPESEMDPELRTVRNIKKTWAQTKATKNPLWEAGYNFYFLTPKTRHSVHSSWSVTDWMNLWSNNFADPYRADKRLASVGDQQLHMNPEDAAKLGLADGDYVWVDANPADRPFIGWDKPENKDKYHVARLMLRVKFNPAYPPGVVMTKHGGFGSTPKTVLAHETRPDGRAVSADTGYQSNFRYGSHQSVTKDWAMPMHQTDTLFHKAKVAQAFLFGGEADNHAINTVPKETLVKITKAEPGGMGGNGAWAPGTTGMAPGAENALMKKYLSGGLTTVRRA